MLPWETMMFLNVRNAGFWRTGRPFALLRMPSLQNLKECFGDPLYTQYFSSDPPLKPIILFMVPPQIPPAAPKKNERSLKTG